MIVSKGEYLPSINIIRDSSLDVSYILTHNALRVLAELNESIDVGFRAFVILGSYGTGKSAFLLQLIKYLQNDSNIFTPHSKTLEPGEYKIIKIIGEYESLKSVLYKKFGVSSNEELFLVLENYYNSSKDGLVMIIDEFGKFLEYSANHNPKEELYFIQRLAEFSNDRSKRIMFIISLHQSFDSYGYDNPVVKNEWEKVHGRFKEIVFSEPVEQLLHIAADTIISNKIMIPGEYDKLIDKIIGSRILELDSTLARELAPKLFPMDLVASMVLTLSLQKYGQNERSLFRFLSTAEFFTDNSLQPAKVFGIPEVYDYLISQYYTILTTKANPDFIKWNLLRNSIDRVESYFEDDLEIYSACIKTIGLLNIFLPTGKPISRDLITSYLDTVLGINNSLFYLHSLETKKIIKYLAYRDRFVLFEGTDLDLESSLHEIDGLIGEINVFDALTEFFSTTNIAARSNYIRSRTPRFFTLKITEQLLKEIPTGEIDGYIYLIFNPAIQIDEILEHSRNNNNLNIYIYFKNSEQIVGYVRELEKIKLLIERFSEDRVALRELSSYREFIVYELNQFVTYGWLTDHNNIVVFNGAIVNVSGKSDFYNLLDKSLSTIYHKTPIIHNELINREKLPAAITTARRALFDKIINSASEEDLGFTKFEFPAEKTIFLALLKSSGIHSPNNSNGHFRPPVDKNFIPLWEESGKFLDSTIHGRRSVAEFYKTLSSAPWKIKKGFLDIWIPIFIYIHRDKLMVVHGDVLIHQISGDFLDILIKVPDEITIKMLNSGLSQKVLFDVYKRIMRIKDSDSLNSSSILSTVKPLFSWFKGLNSFTKSTMSFSHASLALMQALKNSSDPEKLLFVDIPALYDVNPNIQALTSEDLSNFETKFISSIKEINRFHTEVLKEFENIILNTFEVKTTDYEQYILVIKQFLKLINQDYMTIEQRQVYNRLSTDLPDRESWLNSLSSVIVGKNISSLDDAGFNQLKVKSAKILDEIKTSLDFSSIEKSAEDQSFVKISLQETNSERLDKVLRIPNQNIRLSSSDANEIKKVMNRFETKNEKIAFVYRLLKELLNDSEKS